MKFPVILREKLKSGEIELPKDTKYEYSPFRVYRGIAREKDDMAPVARDDFRSYAELGKGKKGRGKTYDQSDPHYYGVSTFLSKECVEQALYFPNPKKKIAAGNIYQEGGPQQTKEDTHHVCWWLYENVDLSGFEII